MNNIKTWDNYQSFVTGVIVILILAIIWACMIGIGGEKVVTTHTECRTYTKTEYKLFGHIQTTEEHTICKTEN